MDARGDVVAELVAKEDREQCPGVLHCLKRRVVPALAERPLRDEAADHGGQEEHGVRSPCDARRHRLRAVTAAPALLSPPSGWRASRRAAASRSSRGASWASMTPTSVCNRRAPRASDSSSRTSKACGSSPAAARCSRSATGVDRMSIDGCAARAAEPRRPRRERGPRCAMDRARARRRGAARRARRRRRRRGLRRGRASLSPCRGASPTLRRPAPEPPRARHARRRSRPAPLLHGNGRRGRPPRRARRRGSARRRGEPSTSSRAIRRRLLPAPTVGVRIGATVAASDARRTRALGSVM